MAANNWKLFGALLCQNLEFLWIYIEKYPRPPRAERVKLFPERHISAVTAIFGWDFIYDFSIFIGTFLFFFGRVFLASFSSFFFFLLLLSAPFSLSFFFSFFCCCWYVCSTTTFFPGIIWVLIVRVAKKRKKQNKTKQETDGSHSSWSHRPFNRARCALVHSNTERLYIER